MAIQDKDLTLMHHCVIVVGAQKDIIAFFNSYNLHQFSLEFDGVSWRGAAPLPDEIRTEFKWLYKKMERLNGDKPKPPTGPKGGGPAPGGSPAGGVVGRYEYTEAIAA